MDPSSVGVPAPRRHTADDQTAGGLPDTHAVAVLLNCSALTVERERKRGRLPYVVVGDKLIRFLPADIEQYLKQNRRVAGQGAVA